MMSDHAKSSGNVQTPVQIQDSSKSSFGPIRGKPASNLRGFHVNPLTPEKKTMDFNFPTQPTTEPEVIGQKQMKYILRVQLATSKTSNHTPTLIKKFVRVLRQADSTLQVFPFNIKQMSSNDIITDEKNLPMGERNFQNGP